MNLSQIRWTFQKSNTCWPGGQHLLTENQPKKAKNHSFYGFLACTSTFSLDLGQQVLTSRSTSAAFLKSSPYLGQIYFLYRYNIPKTHESRGLWSWKSYSWKNGSQSIDFTLFSLLFLDRNSIWNPIFLSDFFST